MKTIQLGDELYDWHGDPEIISTPFYKVTFPEPIKMMEVITDDSTNGIVILGRIEAVVDSIIYTESHGAVGNTTNFSGKNLVILGLPITRLTEDIKLCEASENDIQQWKNEAHLMIKKLKLRIEDPDSSVHINFDDHHEYIIFGRRNFLLVGSEKKFVLVHKKQISVREGETKLVQIDPQDGIIIAKNRKVLHLGGASRSNCGSILGEFGVKVASSVLDQILWD